MGGLHKKFKKIGIGAHLLSGGLLPPTKAVSKAIGSDNYDAIHPLGTQAETAYDAAKASKKALAEVKAEPVIPLADEEELARARRRRTARRSGGRASTVLSDESGFGG